MEVGLFFGSFNPINHGHLIVASEIIQAGLVQELWFVVSPQNPFKKIGSLLNENHRLFLLQEAIEGDSRLKASNIEFKLPKPSYTVNTLAYLKEKYPSHQFSIILGSDSFQNLPKWKNAPYIIQNHRILIYPRKGYDVKDTYGANIHLTQSPLIEISSTHIRKLIRERKSIRYLVPETVRVAIETNLYYFSNSENQTQEQDS